MFDNGVRNGVGEMKFFAVSSSDGHYNDSYIEIMNSEDCGEVGENYGINYKREIFRLRGIWKDNEFLRQI